MMDESTNYYYNYPQGSTPLLNDRMLKCTQPVTVPLVSSSGMDVAVLIPIHRKIHINPSVLLSQQQRESFSEIPSNSSYSSHSSSRTETHSPVKRNKSKYSRRSRCLKKHKRATERRNINNNETKISSRELSPLILGIRADQRRAIRNDDDDVDFHELMNRELSDREKVRRTVDARLWLQAKTALKKANEIVKARGQDQRLENCKKIRLETINKTFVNRGTSPIIFESPCERNSVGEFQIGNVKTEIELLESDDDKCQVIEIDSKMEDKLLRDDDEDNRIVSFSTC
ncbi:uncharacterized protein LOC123269203 [Cotesia glomerata]|uniref:uncharacterized protein LOC123269203 n=1 Tax=Cotesia glomerata TaxID=32391 RepID=UPI001D031909|nr:uncharacterized protein LOC123269203 [Cotesia glomerata]